jgi:hypothetical protein
VKQAKVAASDACDRADGLGVGEIGFVNGETEFWPMARQNEGEFVGETSAEPAGSANTRIHQALYQQASTTAL